MNIYKNDLLDFLMAIAEYFPRRLCLTALGGTAMTLLGLKESTIDIDFDIPREKDYLALIKTLEKLGFSRTSSFSWSAVPIFPYRFDLFHCGYIFSTQLLDDSDHRGIAVVSAKKLNLFCLNPSDLIITKLVRSTARDLEDVLIVYRRYEPDIVALCRRYIETMQQSETVAATAAANFNLFLDYCTILDQTMRTTCRKLLKNLQ